MLHTYPGIDLNKITQRKYNALLNQCFNLKAFDLTGKLEMQTFWDKQKRLQEELRDSS